MSNPEKRPTLTFGFYESFRMLQYPYLRIQLVGDLVEPVIIGYGYIHCCTQPHCTLLNFIFFTLLILLTSLMWSIIIIGSPTSNKKSQSSPKSVFSFFFFLFFLFFLFNCVLFMCFLIYFIEKWSYVNMKQEPLQAHRMELGLLYFGLNIQTIALIARFFLSN